MSLIKPGRVIPVGTRNELYTINIWYTPISTTRKVTRVFEAHNSQSLISYYTNIINAKIFEYVCECV